MVWSITRTPDIRAESTASGGCTSGSTAHRRDATRMAFGGVTTIGTATAELIDALDDVHGVDANAWTDVARSCGVVHRHVGRDDGGDDAAITRPGVVALPSNCWSQWVSPRRPDDTRGRGILLRLGPCRSRSLSTGCRAGCDRDDAASADARRTDRGRRSSAGRRCPAVQRVEDASAYLLP